MTSGASAQPDEDGLRLERTQKWGEALEHMTTALRVLDESDAAAHVGAHLDLAINSLREEIAAPRGADR